MPAKKNSADDVVQTIIRKEIAKNLNALHWGKSDKGQTIACTTGAKGMVINEQLASHVGELRGLISYNLAFKQGVGMAKAMGEGIMEFTFDDAALPILAAMDVKFPGCGNYKAPGSSKSSGGGRNNGRH